jgi:hypothetical protein
MPMGWDFPRHPDRLQRQQKRPNRGASHLSPSRVGSRMGWSYISNSPLCLHRHVMSRDDICLYPFHHYYYLFIYISFFIFLRYIEWRCQYFTKIIWPQIFESVNSKMLCEKRGCCFLRPIRVCTHGPKKAWKTSYNITGVPAEIWTWYVWNTRQKLTPLDPIFFRPYFSKVDRFDLKSRSSISPRLK